MAPVISPTISDDVRFPSTTRVAIVRPSRITVIRSAIAISCCMLCETTITRDVVLAQVADDLEHLLGLAHAERGRRLVEDDDPPAPEQRPGDREALPLPARHALAP